MKNVGGGYIVVGVEDRTWRPVGLPGNLRLDTKALRDKIRKSTGLDIEADIVHHQTSVDGGSKLFALVMIRATAKMSKLRIPSMCKTSFFPSEKWGIRSGDIYVRIGDQTRRLDDASQLEKLLEDLQSRYQEDDLEQANEIPSPFAVESGLYRLLPREYATFIGREGFKDRIRIAVEGDPRIWIINLHGPGGVGKSALATWLAYAYHGERGFEAILHLSAKDIGDKLRT
ncbi:MAG: hypothetical protein M1482_17470 [Chloroflexi bacterium]|nr:hypothetical protein [Chloroflexota bacterium]